MPDLIAAMQNALTAYSAGQVTQPVRSVIEVQRNQSFFGIMPAHAPLIPSLGVKLVTVFGRNAEHGLPSHLATILLMDAQTGALLTVMDGRFITEARTAAVSAVAAGLLARQETRVLAILGSGVQTRSHLEALPLVRPFDEIRCWSPNAGHLDALVAEHPRVQRARSAEDAVDGADVIALVTASPDPVIRSEWVQDGACVISVGACRPNQREMDPALVARARLIVDSRAAALVESGDVLMGLSEGLFTASHIAAELGQVAANPSLGRQTEASVLVFKSLGLAIEDVAAAHLAYQRAKAAGRGLDLA